MLDSEMPPSRCLRICILPHPAMRRTAEWLSDVLATHCDGLDCTVDVGHDQATRVVDDAIYIRPAATDALSLIATEAPLRNACASMARFDVACRDLYSVAWEQLIAKPHATLRALAGYLGLRLSQAAQSAIDTRIAGLRSDLEAYDHPLSFVAALDAAPPCAIWTVPDLADEAGSRLMELISPTVPRAALVISFAKSHATGFPDRDFAGWQVEAFDASSEGFAESMSAISPQGLIYLYYGDSERPIDHLLDQLVPRLADGGVISGTELSEPAAASVVAKLTAHGDRHNLVFSLAGCRWFLLPPAWPR